MCHADVILPGSAGAHMLYFRGFSAPSYEAKPGPYTFKGTEDQ